MKAAGMTRLQFISGGNSFAGQSSNRGSYSLGDVAKIDQIEVRWPTGQREVFTGMNVDKLSKIVEGSGKPVK